MPENKVRPRFLSRLSLACLAALCAATSLAHDDHGENGGGGGQGDGNWSSWNMTVTGRLDLQTLGFGNSSVFGNSCWGWTDPSNGREYAIMGLTNGVAFVDVTNPWNPVHLGNLATKTGSSAWRDVRVYKNRAYIVSDNNGAHGMQMFNLERLRGVNSVQTWTEDGWYGGVTRTHTININENTGYAYLTGTNTDSGGLHIVDVDPARGTYMQKVGAFAGDGYTHETSVFTYQGPDAAHFGKEIAFAANEDTVTVIDVSNKAATQMLSRKGYPNHGYTHQGWLSEDHKYFVYNDELDETGIAGATKARTHVMNVQDLDNPVYLGFFEHTESSIDHNLYIKGDLMFASNYTAGLRVIHLHDLGMPNSWHEVGYVDTRANDDAEAFRGAWNNYPFFPSGTIIISDINEGLFVVRMNPVPEPATMMALGAGVLGVLGARRRRKK